MLQRFGFSFYELIRHAEAMRKEAELFSSSMPAYKMDDGTRVKYRELLDQFRAECDALLLRHTFAMASHKQARLAEREEGFTYSELLNDLDGLLDSFGNELRSELFVRVPREMEPSFQNDALFGSDVADAFPSSAEDIQHAGTCFALGLNDASVFHSMRVLERGLSAIAGKLDVGSERKNWANVIDQIEAALKKQGTGPGVDVEERKLLAQAAIHFRFVKDAWRNDVMHANEKYDTGKAQSVLANVREFIQALVAAGLTEPAEQV